MKRVCVFCGSRFGAREEYRVGAAALGRALAERGIGLVYGGGNVGLMGVVADAALAAGGEVIGVIPRALQRKEVAHAGVNDLRVVETMHERKAMMAELSDGFIALPGGIGTLEEFAEVVSWGVLGIHRKPCALMNQGGYFNSLIRFADEMVTTGFLKPVYRELILVGQTPEGTIEALENYSAPDVPHWLGTEQV